MSKVTDALNERDIFNPHNVASKSSCKVWVSYYREWNTRGCGCSGWRVYNLKKSYSNPYDGGAQMFIGNKNSSKFEEAMNFACQETGETEWAKSPFDSWHPLKVFEELQIKPGKKWTKNVVSE